MQLKLFSVFDQKAAAYLPPFTTTTYGLAERMFLQAAQDENHAFNQHPEDYCLFMLGTFDDQTGVLEDCKPEVIINGLTAVAKLRERHIPTLVEEKSDAS